MRLVLALWLLTFASCASDYGSATGASPDDDIYAFRAEHARRMKAIDREREMGRSDLAYDSEKALRTPDTGASGGGGGPDGALSAPPVRMIRIDVVNAGVRRELSRQKGAGGVYEGNNVRIVKPAPPPGKGGAAGVVSGGNWAVEGSASQRGTTSYSNTSSYIVVMDGGVGYLNISATGAAAERIPLGGGHEAVVLGQRETGHRLAVRARIVGPDTIEVTVFPAWLGRDRRGNQTEESLGTTLTVRNGQSFVIGGLDTAGSGSDQRLLARGEADRVSGSSVVLRATILGGGR